MWMSPEDNSVLLAIAVPYDGEKVNGNGTMKGIALDTKEEVDVMYAKAMSEKKMMDLAKELGLFMVHTFTI